MDMLAEYATVWAWLVFAILGQLSSFTLGMPAMATSVQDALAKGAVLFAFEVVADCLVAFSVASIMPMQVCVPPRRFKAPMELCVILCSIFFCTTASSQL